MDPEQYGPPHDKLARAIMRLPKYERLIVTLTYFEDLADVEVAKILELDLETVQQLRARAVRRLRDALR